MSGRPRIAVFGSVHVDLIAHAERLPEKATSALAHGFDLAMGGKGGHQAAECAAAGAEVFMVTELGDDDFGAFLLSALKARGVDCSKVAIAIGAKTGTSTVLSAPEGYTSLIYPGVAAAQKADDVAARIAALAPFDMILLQAELPQHLSLAAAQAAKAVGARVVLNAAPPGAVDPALLKITDLLVVNMLEANALGAQAADELARHISGDVVMTLGAAGSVASDGVKTHRRLAPPSQVKSTVGAGDAFLAGLCVQLCREYNLALGLDAGTQSASRKIAGLRK
jgi:ribokinase